MFLFRYLIVLISLCVCKICAISSFLDSKAGMTTNKNGRLKISCSNPQSRSTDDFKRANVSLSFKKISIIQCAISNTTYIDEFNALNINTTAIVSLHLRFAQDMPLSPGNYTKGLRIRHLSIESQNSHHLKNNPNFFDPLSNLQSMYVAGIEVPPLPKTMRLINLTLMDGATMKDWGNCDYMERFELSSLNSEEFPIWPQNCLRLEYLEINRMLPEITLKVTERMMAAAASLQTLKITNCGLNTLPIEIIQNAKNLVNLDLSKNKLYDELFPAFPFLANLRSLDLSSNLVGGYGLGSLVPKLPVLSKLILNDEREFHRVCMGGSSLKSNFIVPLQNSSIELLEFKDTEFYLDCFENIHFFNLKHISMSPSTVELKLIALPKTNAEYLQMDFGDDNFLTVLFDEDDYNTLKKENSSSPYNRRNLTVLFSYVRCDCGLGWLVRALRDFPHMISMPNVRCDHPNGIEILKMPKERLECNMTLRDSCTYRQSWSDGLVTAACGFRFWMNMQPSLPIHGLNVSEQGIATLNTKLPETIQWLDLRRNRLARASAEEAAALFAEGRRVWLSDNLLLCSCDNRAFLDAIQLHRQQVQDYELLKCVGCDTPISLVSTDALCQVALIASLSVIGVLMVIAGLIAYLLRQHAQQLRVFLYSRGWCISCLQKQDSDDKPYDAFISFAHEDQEYVMETLLPGLENAPEQFRICVHYRDWPIGDWIPDQIMRSVQHSKRTLILLSRNFVASAWSTLEFRYSLANATEDPNAKVLILIKDDVLDMNLDMELRGYVTYNTYMRCDDPWFWEKLRYAMPHRLNKTTASEDIDLCVRDNKINKNRAIRAANSKLPGNVEMFSLQTCYSEI